NGSANETGWDGGGDARHRLASSRPGLAWPGLAWPGLAWPGLAWPGQQDTLECQRRGRRRLACRLGCSGSPARRGAPFAGDVTDGHDHQRDPVVVVSAQPPAGPPPGRTDLQMVVAGNLVGPGGDSAEAVLKPGAF